MSAKYWTWWPTKWSLYIVTNLSDGPRRFTELKRAVAGVSRRMLTVTLRRLQRDGILTRTVNEVMPSHVTYRLTPLAISLLHAAAPSSRGARATLAQVAAARADYDRNLDAQATDTEAMVMSRSTA